MIALLSPPRGSPAYAMSSPMDEGAPTWALRPATPAEQTEIDEARRLQTQIRQRLGGRQSPSNNDMQAVLSQYGANWPMMLPKYTLAINTMDQGVRV
jgi:hypothetical protein